MQILLRELADEVVEGRVALRGAVLQGGGEVDLLDRVGLLAGVRDGDGVLGLV